MKTWKMISFVVAVPAVLICSYNALMKEQEHHSHPRAEFKPYSHLRIRKKVCYQIDLTQVSAILSLEWFLYIHRRITKGANYVHPSCN